jgi:hypothetical protein
MKISLVILREVTKTYIIANDITLYRNKRLFATKDDISRVSADKWPLWIVAVSFIGEGTGVPGENHRHTENY